jgi:hypothetical protein
MAASWIGIFSGGLPPKYSVLPPSSPLKNRFSIFVCSLMWRMAVGGDSGGTAAGIG